MRKNGMRRKLCAAVLAGLLALSAAACGEDPVSGKQTVIQVSPEGNDANDGIDSPVATIQRALELAREQITSGNVTIDIADGTYTVTEPIAITEEMTDGVNGHTLTLLGHGGAVISGGVTVSGWEAAGENLWKAALPELEAANGFYVDGENMTLARMKVLASYADADGKAGISMDDGKSYANFSDYNSFAQITGMCFTTREEYELDPEALAAEVSHIRLYYDQTFMRTVMDLAGAAQNDGSYTFTVSESTLKLLNGAKMADYDSGANKWYLVNSYLFLDQEGEYYFDKESRTLYYYSEESPEGKSCVIPVAEGLLTVQGTEEKLAGNVTVQNLTFAHGTTSVLAEHPWKEIQSDAYVIEDSQGENAEKGYVRIPLPAQLTIDLASNVTVKNCEFRNFETTAVGIRSYVYNTTVTDNRIENVSGSGIAVGTFNLNTGYGIEDKGTHPEDLAKVYSVKKNSVVPAGLTISNNEIKNCGIESMASNGILLYYGYETDITNNTVEEVGGTGISLGWGWNNWTIKQAGSQNTGNILVEGNRIVSSSTRIKDAGGIYTLGAFHGEGCLIQKNFIDMEGSVTAERAIYLDEGSELVTVTENVSVNTHMWLSARALPLIASGGGYQGGEPANNTIMNCRIEGNYSSAENIQQSFTAGYAWPYASEIESAHVTIKDNTVDENWEQNKTIMEIVDAAGATGDVGVYTK